MEKSLDEIQAASSNAAPHLKRVLTLRDLIFYGFILTSPIAAVPEFGVAQKLSQGHGVATLFAAMGAMVLTAVSYGRMAAVFPSAGAAYTYTGRGLNPHVGFLVGWAMFLEYLLQPSFNSIYTALILQRILPQIPYAVTALLSVGLLTFLNLRGVRSTAHTNLVLTAIMTAVIGIFMVLAVAYLFQHAAWGGLFSVQPIYNRQTFDFQALWLGTAFMSVTYVGFDGPTTLAEEVDNPRRNVLLATVTVCVITGVFGALQVYLAARVWPDYSSYTNPETAFIDVARRVGGPLLFHAMAAILVVSGFGCGLTGQVGAARLLFSMGRDNMLPRTIFAHLDAKRHNPTYNIWIIGVIAYAAALLMSWQRSIEVFNFVTFLTFMGVNLAALSQFYLRREPGRQRRFLADALVPVLGFLFCMKIWWSLPKPAKIFGSLLLAGGFAYSAIKTRGFRTQPAMIDFNEL